LPVDATPLEKAKYKICEKILAYQQDNDLSDEQIAKDNDTSRCCLDVDA